MSEKTVIECDGGDCCNDYEHIGGDFMISEFVKAGWVYVPEHETHYCPKCKPIVIYVKRNNVR